MSAAKKQPEVPAAGAFCNLFVSQPSDSPPADEPHSKVSLRQKAEAHFREREELSSEKLEALPPESMRTILYELRVHQIELEMQNEELRAAQADLDAERAHYFDLYDLAPVGYVTISEAGLILEANLTASTLLDVKRPALIKKPLSRFVLQEDRDIFHLLINQPHQTGWPMCDLRMVKSDGTTFWAHLKKVSARDKNDAPVCRIVLSDITWRKKAEEMVRDASIYSRNLIETSLDPLVTISAEGKITDVNAATEKITGWNRDRLVGTDFSDYFTDPEMARAGYQKVFSEGKVVDYPLAIRHTSGSVTDVLYNASVYRNDQGEVIGVFAAARDITERKRAEETLHKKNAEITNFTTAVSHDLKSPLVTIKTFLGYLDEDLKTNKAGTVAKDLGFIHGAADKMERLLDQILEFARIGHQKVAPVMVTLQEVVQEALDLVAGQIAERGVQVEATQETVWLHGDRFRLVQIFQNLVDNAVKFLGDQPAPRIEIGAEQEDGEIFLFVRDNGKGIEPQSHSKLFGLFEKLDPRTPGSGVGLATVRRIVEAHGGKIRVQSDGRGKGATFRFTLAKTERNPISPA